MYRHRLDPCTPCLHCLLCATRRPGCDPRVGGALGQEGPDGWAPAAQESARRRAGCAGEWGSAAGSSSLGPQPQPTGQLPPPPLFSVSAVWASTSKDYSHKAQGHGQPGLMFVQGAAPVVDPFMPQRPPPPPRLKEVQGPSSALDLRYSYTYNDEAQCAVPPLAVAGPLAVDPVPARPARAAARAPRAMEHVGEADARLDGAVRPSAGPPPLAGPRDKVAAGGPPAHGGGPWSVSHARRPSSGRCSRASSAWRISSWDASSRGPPRGQTVSGCFRRCSRSPRASSSLGPPSTKPTAGGTRQRPTLAIPPPALGPGSGARCGGPATGAPVPPTWAQAPHHKALTVEVWDGEAEESGGHWVGVTHDGTLLYLLWGNRLVAVPPDPRDVARAVLAPIALVYAVWYGVLPAPGNPQLLPQHQYPGADADTTAWRQRRGVQVVFHTP